MLFKRIVTLSITFLILFADSGQMIYAHTCLLSHHTSFSLYIPNHCCAEDEKETTKTCCAEKAETEKTNCALGKMDCCSLSSKYVKQSFPNHEIKSAANEMAKDVMKEVELFTAYVSATFNNLIFSSPPPLLRCKDDIRFTGVFRI